MYFKDLRDYLKALANRNELKEIDVLVSPILEVAEIADRTMKSNGPALFFKNVESSSFPLVMNMFGTEKRTAFALGVASLNALQDRMKELIDQKAPESLLDKIKMLPLLKQISDFFPKTRSDGACHEVIINANPDLNILPIVKTWPLDGGKFITLPLVFTKDPETGIRNVGMYRMHVYDEKTTGMHWHVHKHGAGHFRRYKELGKRMDVAVAIGTDPQTLYAATAPLPDGIDEMIFAGFLREEPVELVKCITCDIEVPAYAEFILEGYVDTDELRTEGPFGDHTGYYSMEDKYPVFHITAITHRKNAIYPATIVGKPPMEDGYLGKASERFFLPLIKKMFPEIVDINLPIEGVFHNMAFVSIDKSIPGHARKIINALWGLGQFMFTKFIIVFDRDVNVQDIKEIIWRLGNNVDPLRDTIILSGPVDILNHAAPETGYGSKIGIDATKKLKEEGHLRQWPPDIVMPQEIKELVTKKWKEYGID
ncbi:MAG: menaquinone biosynthesis decarboxylase [Deltaproteobacteria bacterium]|nr:menaquinone biosynthesis decarboxylase [Deltaproteobacteria bacterium]MCL5791880.1 menaquinone biosynthesis decarboxylase [Deltaproteobacteria bacterium]